MTNRQNWAECYTYLAARIHAPRTLEEVQEIVGRSEKVKALGTRHAFNDSADSSGDLISLEHLNQLIDLNLEDRTVTVGAGMRYGELGKVLNEHGLALSNLASLPHISIVGACATATHGSGDQNGNLATSICGIEYVTGDGSLVTFSRSSASAGPNQSGSRAETFTQNRGKPESESKNAQIVKRIDSGPLEGAVVALGALGIATSVTLDLVPEFWIRQDVYEGLPLETALNNFDEIMSGAYSTSLFTDWQTPKINQTWRKRLTTPDDKIEADPTYFGGTLAKHDLNPIKNASPENCTSQTGIPGLWNNRLNHFRMEFTPSVGEELQSEYLVPRQHAVAAIRAVHELADQIAPHLYLTEIRSIAADNLWLSTAYKQDSIAIHFTWHKEWESVHALMPKIEAALSPFSPRPHWGKLFTVPREVLQPRYPKLEAFCELAQRYDRTGKFRNAFLDRNIF